MSASEVNRKSEPSGESARKKRNYRLIVDPELRKEATKKVYRFDGCVPGHAPIPSPRDPRTQKTILGGSRKIWELPVPRFKYDRFSVCEAPKWEILVTGLTPQITATLLKGTCSQVGPVSFVKLHREGQSGGDFLGAASVGFKKHGDGETAVELLSGFQLHGCTLSVELDDQGEKARQLLREQGNKKCASSKQTGDRTPASMCGSEGGSDSVFTPELSLSLVGIRTSRVESAKDTPPSLMSPVTPASAGTASSLKFFPQQGSTSSMAGVLSSPSMDMTPSSLDSGISIATLASLREQKAQDQNVTNQPLMMSSLFLRQDAANSSSAVEYSRSEVVVGGNARAQPVCTHKPLRSNSMERVCNRAGNLETAEGYSRISSSEDEADGKMTQKDAVGGTCVQPKPVASVSPMSDISDAEPVPLPQGQSSPLTKFSNTFTPVVTASSGYSLATFDASVSLQVIRALKVSSMANEAPTPTYTMEVEEISGDESPELVVADSKVEGEENGVSSVTGDDMEMSDEDSNGGIVVESGRIEVGEPPARLLPISPLPAYPPPLMTVSVPPPGFGPTTPPFPPPLPPHAAASLGIPPPPLPGLFFPQGVPPPPLLGTAYPPFPPPLYPQQPPLLEEKLKPSSHEEKKKMNALKCEVLKKAVSQLREVLMRDLQRRYIDTIGRAVTDKHWEVQQQKRKLSAAGASQAKPSVDEPYRRMLVPAGGGVSEKALSASSHGGPKHLTKFRIPTISRGSARGSQVLVVRKSESDWQSQAKTSLYSDLSSVDSGSDWERTEEDDEEREVKAVEGVVAVEEEYDTQPGEDVLSSMSESSASEMEEEGEEEEADSTLDVIKNTEGAVEDGKDEDYLPVSFQKKKPKKTLDVADVFSDSEEEVMDIDIVGNGVPEVVDLPHREKADVSEYLHIPEKQKDDQSPALPSSLSSPPLLPPQFSKRSSSEEERILSSLLVSGPDKEDIQMMRLALIRMKQEGESLAKRTHWAFYPGLPTEAPLAAKRRRLASMDMASQQHHTGCARAEGFYKIDAFAKKGYVTSIGVQQQTGPAAKQQIKKESKTSGRGNRVAQRRLASVYATSEVYSDALKYSHLKARKKMVRFARSTIHGWGLFALEDIPADEMVIEYVGEVIRSLVADERERRYESMGIGSSYLFRLDLESVIDATKRGGVARFINHCCDPNCYAKVIAVGNQKKIVIYSKRDIRANEEITYDYKFPIEDEKIPCLCGAPHCRGTLN